MNRHSTLACAALLLSACSHDAAPTQTPVSVTPPPVAEPACPAEVAPIAPFTLLGDASVEDRLHPEMLEQPVRATCERELFILIERESHPRNVATIETEAGPRLVLHQAHAMAVLPAQKLALVAADSGLWAYAAETMVRYARLVPNRIVDVVSARNGSRIAYIRQDPKVGETEAARELVVVDVPSLRIVRRIANPPAGRLRLSDDGALLTIARRGNGIANPFADRGMDVTTYDATTGAERSFATRDLVHDTFAVPNRPGVVAYVGGTNKLLFRDLRSGAEIPQASNGETPLMAGRDLLSVFYEPSLDRYFVGGMDNTVHEYTGIFGESPTDAKRTRVRGEVVDITCCAEGAVVAGTDLAGVAWIKDGSVVREIGPFLPESGGAPTHVAVVGNSTVIEVVGRVFTWTRDGFLIRPEGFTGEEVARTTEGANTLLVVRSRGWYEFHRVPTNAGLSGETSLLGTADWSVVDGTFELANGAHIFIGRRHGRVAIALVPLAGGITLHQSGPRVGVSGRPVVVARGDGIHFAVWDFENKIIEVDGQAGTMRASHTIEGARPNAVSIAWENDHWKVVDEAGVVRALTPIAVAPAAPQQP